MSPEIQSAIATSLLVILVLVHHAMGLKLCKMYRGRITELEAVLEKSFARRRKLNDDNEELRNEIAALKERDVANEL